MEKFMPNARKATSKRNIIKTDGEVLTNPSIVYGLRCVVRRLETLATRRATNMSKVHPRPIRGFLHSVGPATLSTRSSQLGPGRPPALPTVRSHDRFEKV